MVEAAMEKRFADDMRDADHPNQGGGTENGDTLTQLKAGVRRDAPPIEHMASTEADTSTGELALFDQIRSAGVAIGPSLLLDLVVAAGTVAVATGSAFRPKTGPSRLVRPLAVLGAAFPWVYFLAIRPWHRRWGATEEEARMTLPGDELVPDPGYENTRAVTIHASAEEVWTWLAQIGQDRDGFYSYEWLENLAGCDIHNANRIYPEWQDVKAGDPLAIVRGWRTRLAAVEPGRSLVIAGWGTYAIRPIDGHTSRLIARARHQKGRASLAYLLTVEIPHFIMERKMLLGIKERAERAKKAQQASRVERIAAGHDVREDTSPRRCHRKVTIVDMSRCPCQAASRRERDLSVQAPRPEGSAAGDPDSTSPSARSGHASRASP
jgi:hypothetical protein